MGYYKKRAFFTAARIFSALALMPAASGGLCVAETETLPERQKSEEVNVRDKKIDAEWLLKVRNVLRSYRELLGSKNQQISRLEARLDELEDISGELALKDNIINALSVDVKRIKKEKEDLGKELDESRTRIENINGIIASHKAEGEEREVTLKKESEALRIKAEGFREELSLVKKEKEGLVSQYENIIQILEKRNEGLRSEPDLSGSQKNKIRQEHKLKVKELAEERERLWARINEVQLSDSGVDLAYNNVVIEVERLMADIKASVDITPEAQRSDGMPPDAGKHAMLACTLEHVSADGKAKTSSGTGWTYWKSVLYEKFPRLFFWRGRDEGLKEDMPLGGAHASLPKQNEAIGPAYKVPIYPDADLADLGRPLRGSSGQGIDKLEDIVQLNTDVDPGQVYEWYKDKIRAQGWSVIFEREPGAVIPGMIKARKDYFMLIISVFQGDRTGIVGTVHEKRSDAS